MSSLRFGWAQFLVYSGLYMTSSLKISCFLLSTEISCLFCVVDNKEIVLFIHNSDIASFQLEWCRSY